MQLCYEANINIWTTLTWTKNVSLFLQLYP